MRADVQSLVCAIKLRCTWVYIVCDYSCLHISLTPLKKEKQYNLCSNSRCLWVEGRKWKCCFKTLFRRKILIIANTLRSNLTSDLFFLFQWNPRVSFTQELWHCVILLSVYYFVRVCSKWMIYIYIHNWFILLDMWFLVVLHPHLYFSFCPTYGLDGPNVAHKAPATYRTVE